MGNGMGEILALAHAAQHIKRGCVGANDVSAVVDEKDRVGQGV